MDALLGNLAASTGLDKAATAKVVRLGAVDGEGIREQPPASKWAKALEVVDAAAAQLKADREAESSTEPFVKVIDQLIERLAVAEKAVAQAKSAELRAEAAEARERKMAAQVKMVETVVEELKTADTRIRALEKRLSEASAHEQELTGIISQLRSAQGALEARSLQAEERAREAEQWLERLSSAVTTKLSTMPATATAVPSSAIIKSSNLGAATPLAPARQHSTMGRP